MKRVYYITILCHLMYSVTILSSIHPWKWYLISSHNFGLISYSPFYWDVFLFHIFVDIFLLFFLDCFVFQQCSPGPKKSIVLTKIHSKFAKQFIDSRTSISVPVILCFLFKKFQIFFDRLLLLVRLFCLSTAALSSTVSALLTSSLQGKRGRRHLFYR